MTYKELRKESAYLSKTLPGISSDLINRKEGFEEELMNIISVVSNLSEERIRALVNNIPPEKQYNSMDYFLGREVYNYFTEKIQNHVETKFFIEQINF